MVERIMKISSKDKTFDKGATMQKLLVVPALGLLLAGCNPADGTVTGVASNDGFSLYCPNVGINDNQCVLSDPENPYANDTVDDVTKWTLSSAASNARDKFYVWSTALAADPSGENQYNVALSLHELYDDNANAAAHSQAKLAYKSALDNFFSGTTGSAGEFVADSDFSFAEWGSGSTLNGAYDGDADFPTVYQVQPGWGWGGETSALAMTGFDAGFASNYENLVFKIKGLPTDNVVIKFPGAVNGADGELSLSVTTYGTPVPGTTGWTQVVIPMSVWGGVTASTEFAIMGGWGNGGTLLITDIGFTGDTTGNGLVKDVMGDGIAAVYMPSNIHDGQTRAAGDFIADTDFSFAEWGSGSTLNGAYDSDADFSPVFQVQPGWGWGGETSALAMSGFEAGFASKYENLVFKIKGLPTDNVVIKFPGAVNGTDGELSLATATYGTAIPGATGWTQFVIPMSTWGGVTASTEFAIMGGWGNGGTLLITDIGFTGNTTSGNMVKDSADGFASIYYPQTAGLASVTYVRDLVGANLVEPDGMDNLYDDAAAAETALSGWGFSYDTATNTLTAD
jgi:hypothetical protein